MKITLVLFGILSIPHSALRFVVQKVTERRVFLSKYKYGWNNPRKSQIIDLWSIQSWYLKTVLNSDEIIIKNIDHLGLQGSIIRVGEFEREKNTPSSKVGVFFSLSNSVNIKSKGLKKNWVLTLLSYPGHRPRYANGARESYAHGDNNQR
ncbi:MAG: hypothetical protein F6K37_42040, partial [Moorea sp. SIO4E2]|uniref:hypothetical protein n=1 Tax=Moorena sp. SIO4E2 TaxID=2607826 RepID=UPI0013B95456